MSTKQTKAELFKKNNDLLKQLHDLQNLNKFIEPKSDSDKLIQKPASRLYRYETDLLHWRTALNNMETVINPVTAEYIRLCRELVLDPIVSNAIDIRKSYVMARDWNFKNSNNEIDEKATDFFNDFWFHKFIGYTLDSIWWGYSLMKIGDIVKDKLTGIELIQRQNVCPAFKKILETPFNLASGIYFEDYEDNISDVEDWYVFASDSHDFNYEGLFSKLAPFQIIHKCALIAQNDFTNRFGSPNILAKSDLNNEKTIRQLENYLSNFNSSSYAICDTNADITLIESSGKSSEAYISLQKRCEELIYKTLLGNALANEQSFVGSAGIKQNLTNLFSLKDIKYVEHHVNNKLIPKLVNLGLKFLDGVTFNFDITNKVDPSIQFNQLIALLQTGQYTVEDKFIEDTFGIPVKSLASPIFKENNTTENVPA